MGEFVELVGACGSPNSALVWFECVGNSWCDVLGDGTGYDPTWDGAASYGADMAIRLYEWYDSCRCEGVKSCWFNFAYSEVSKDLD